MNVPGPQVTGLSLVELQLLKCLNRMQHWETIQVVIRVDTADKAILHEVMAFPHRL